MLDELRCLMPTNLDWMNGVIKEKSGFGDVPFSLFGIIGTSPNPEILKLVS